MELQFHQYSGMRVWPLAMPHLTSAIYIQFPVPAEWQTAEAYNKTLSLSLSMTSHSSHHNVQDREPTGLGGLHPISV